ncbi:IS256 family transposase, partial [Shigella flexneri]
GKTLTRWPVFVDHFTATKKWTMPIRNWKPAMNRFMIEFGDRLNGHL